jgi:hypothetical protein
MQDIPFENDTQHNLPKPTKADISLGSSITIIGFMVTMIAITVAVYVYQKNGHFTTADVKSTPTSVRIEALHPPFPTR